MSTLHFNLFQLRMKSKLEASIKALADCDEKLIDKHGEGILESGYTYAFLAYEHTCALYICGHGGFHLSNLYSKNACSGVPFFFWGPQVGRRDPEDFGRCPGKAWASPCLFHNHLKLRNKKE